MRNLLYHQSCEANEKSTATLFYIMKAAIENYYTPHFALSSEDTFWLTCAISIVKKFPKEFKSLFTVE